MSDDQAPDRHELLKVLASVRGALRLVRTGLEQPLDHGAQSLHHGGSSGPLPQGITRNQSSSWQRVATLQMSVAWGQASGVNYINSGGGELARQRKRASGGHCWT